MDPEYALTLFEQGDENTARRAFEYLRTVSEPVVKAHVRLFGLNHYDSDAVLNDTFLKAWIFRSSFVNRGFGAWIVFLKTVASNRALDHIKMASKWVPLDADWDAASADRPVIDKLLSMAQTADLQTYADECWLGISKDLSEQERAQRILAAQLFYVDGLDWKTILRIVGSGANRGEQPDRATLDSWLADPGVIRSMVYHELYYCNDKLASILLGMKEMASPDTLNKIARDARAADPESEAMNGWTWGEVAVILWRYRNALLPHQIAARKDCQLNAEQLEALYVKCASLFPFIQIMDRLLSTPGFEPGSLNRSYMASPGLWKRLIFQYAYVDDLTYNDMLERTEPSASQVEYAITETGSLRGWIANGRLLKELVKYCMKRNRGGHNDY